MSSNPVHGEVCSMQHYVIKFVSDLLWQVGDSHQVSSTNETARHDAFLEYLFIKYALTKIVENQII